MIHLLNIDVDVFGDVEAALIDNLTIYTFDYVIATFLINLFAIKVEHEIDAVLLWELCDMSLNFLVALVVDVCLFLKDVLSFDLHLHVHVRLNLSDFTF